MTVTIYHNPNCALALGAMGSAVFQSPALKRRAFSRSAMSGIA